MGPGFPQANAQPAQQAAIIIALVAIFIVVLVYLATSILFLISLQRTLEAVKRRNRTLEPGLVWLLLVPILNLFWVHVLAKQIPRSLQNEYSDRGWNTAGESFAFKAGQVWSWATILEIFASIASEISQSPFIKLVNVAFLIAIACSSVSFWVQTASYRRELKLRKTNNFTYDLTSELEAYTTELSLDPPDGEWQAAPPKPKVQREDIDDLERRAREL
ncbi:hypothetical protein KIH39_12510 [Telmatocola sphagniphila]|uniref:DUF4328 domain-containing protein n=1 Tax=Telmatocola sphagniphila TaxID=1123043 RepID=A0A8E6F0M1_9BACT|nr:hypothetical protein [Telmatocola sphagniphila]QVL34691.1 hypothetical protein KIH39_12510 [Telmatocola sphagniphila]